MNQVSLVIDIWDSISSHLPLTDRTEAAEDLITILIDVYGMDPKELHAEFAAHPQVRRVLKQYLIDDDQHADEDDDQDDNEYD